MHFLGFIDVVLASFIFGGNIWFFFLQSPTLIGFVGRDKFVPIQMRLTKLLFRAVSVVAILLVVVAWFANLNTQAMLGADLTLAAALIANFFIIPRALKAGGKGRQETQAAGGDHSITKFASEGTGPSASFWHRMVVLFVVLILVGALLNLYAVTA
ncbi:MAG: DUF4149 domain-containing protein [Paracoccaceae bacterium]|jgi:hypothetical protein|nr:DUF4149 domain-containing protein [Paracoccaceae bacterium]